MTTAALFARIKVRIILNGLRASIPRSVLMLLASIFACGAGAAGAWTIAQQRYNPSTATGVLISTFVLVFVGWVVIPIVAFGTDDTVDPAKLSLLPLTNGQMLAGMTVASFVGIPAVATLVLLSGTVAGYAPAGPAALVTVAGVATEVAMCIIGSRAIVTAMSSLLRSRRGRDLGVIILSLLCTSFFFLRALIGQAATSLGQNAASGSLVSIVRWTPPGMAAESVLAAQHGHLAVALANLAAALATVAFLALWWTRGIARSTVGTDRSYRSAVRGHSTPLFPRFLARLIPRTPTGAVAARELRYASREPRRRTMTVQSALLGLVVPLGTPAIRDGHHPDIVFAAAIVPALICLSSLNSFGMDGPAMWIDVGSSPDLGPVLRGKNAMQAALASLVLIPVVAILATVEGSWAHVPEVCAAALCMTGVVIGIGNIASVTAPVPLPESSHNAFATGGGGRGCITAFIQLASMVAVAVLAAPAGAFMAASIHSAGTPVQLLAATVCIAYGYIVWRAGLSLALKVVKGREPELLAAIAPRSVV